ncbi:GGDEF domain-containing protein [Comamonas sp. UBA7528]|uniref:GGDEF domain-containing protein n=1 Tax=Comamonas sp. UBA7528 TaxID=1946391 RepID=UPI0025C394B1|nr:GGDEF domain-containing protein [Comamonas sp. UBA7528]
MSTYPDEHYAADWQRILQAAPPAARAQVQQLAIAHQQALAQHFYGEMLQDSVAATMLDHAQVQQRLSASMQAWVASVFSAAAEGDLLPLVAQQKRIGEVHARIDIPMHVVLRGARTLKDRMYALLQAQPQDGAVALVSSVIDLTMEIMGQAYAVSHDRQSQAKEAYRHFELAQNVSTERERRRANLLDWENQLMFAHAVGSAPEQLPQLGQSEFGLWFRHKGAHVFQGTHECTTILGTMDAIDVEHLPALHRADSTPADRLALLHTLRDHTRRIAFLLDSLFEQSSALEAGRDVLTRLLNRKFLPVVLDKEVHYAREGGHSFSVLSIDLDHFKQVNDTHGHEAGDMVLQQVASLLSQHSRGGDYLFRLGGEEFILVLVDAASDAARRTAERMRQHIAREMLHLPRNQTLQVTVSIGVATFDGHPDYQMLLRRADAALYQAKHLGRNRVELAGE